MNSISYLSQVTYDSIVACGKPNEPNTDSVEDVAYNSASVK